MEARLMKQKPKTILKKALAILSRKGGWCVRFFEDGMGACCALGAINKAAVGDAYGVTWGGAAGKARKILGKVVGCGTDGIAEWNNRQKTKQPVLAAFRKAIEKA